MPNITTPTPFDHILFWPVQLEGPEIATTSPKSWVKWIEAQGKNGGTQWVRAGLWNRGDPGITVKQHLAEASYFYPFVRDILFRESESESHCLEVMVRDDVKTVSVQAKKDSQPVIFDVRRMQLYLVETRVAMLVVELTNDLVRPIGDLAEVLDSFRRTYPPYYDREDRGGHCPQIVEWQGSGGSKLPGISTSTYHGQTILNSERHTPVSKHFEDLLKPLVHWEPSKADREKHPATWRQLGDERMLSMTFLALPDPKALTRQDFIRLTFLDAGSSDTLPYSEAFMADFEQKHCYDRYWDPDTPGHDWMTTRFTNCGHHMLIIAKDDREDKWPFVMDARSGLLFHFRQHYFHLGMFVHMQHASLITFLELLYRAIRKPGGEERNVAVQDIQERFARFSSGIWFTELTPQTQGRELYALWMRQMGTLQLYDEVKAEIGLAHDVLTNVQRDRQSKQSLDLTKLATLILPLTAVVGIFGMNYPVFPDWEFYRCYIQPDWWPWAGLALEVLLLCVFWFAAYSITRFILRTKANGS